MYKRVTRPYSAHKILFDNVPNNSTVLDVGCASGYLAARLTTEKGCTVDGIEKDPISANTACEYCRTVWELDLRNFDAENLTEQYDVIVLGDILEHLEDPEKLLQKLCTSLRKDGIILISIPNIAAYETRLLLLFGKWEYTDRGLMDRTHLRFFTRFTAKMLVTNVGLVLVKEYFAPHPRWIPQCIFHYHALHRLNLMLAQLWPEMFALQFVFRLQRDKN